MNTTEALRLVAALTESPDTGTASEPGIPGLNVGDSVLVRTVTHYHVGRITALTSQWLQLDAASWVAATGRFHQCLLTGEFDEVEPFVNPVAVSLGSVIDVTAWPHALPKAAK